MEVPSRSPGHGLEAVGVKVIPVLPKAIEIILSSLIKKSTTRRNPRHPLGNPLKVNFIQL